MFRVLLQARAGAAILVAATFVLGACTSGGASTPTPGPAPTAASGASPAASAVASPAASRSAEPASSAVPAGSPVAGARPSASAVVSPVPSVLPTPGGPLTPLRISIPNKGVAFLYLYAAMDLGIYQRHGFDAQISVLAGQPAVAALQSNETDFMAAIGSATRAALTGLPFRIVDVASNKPDYLMLGQKGMTSLNDLAGKTVAFYAPANTVNVAGVQMLKSSGIDASQYTVLNAGDGPSRAAALVAGVAQGALLEVTDAAPLQAQGYPVLARAGDLVELPFSGLAASQSALSSRRDVMREAVRATLEGQQTARTQKDQVVPVMIKEFNLSAQDASTIFDEVSPDWTTDGRPSQAAEQFEFQNDQQDMNLSQPIQPDQVYDFSLLNDVGVAPNQ